MMGAIAFLIMLNWSGVRVSPHENLYFFLTTVRGNGTKTAAVASRRLKVTGDTIMRNSVRTPVFAILGNFGERLDSFSTQLTPTDVLTVLGHNPHSSNWKNLDPELRKIYELIQRKAKADRRAGTAEYIWGRFQSPTVPGAFPAISIGLTEPVEFTAIKDALGNETPAGQLWLPGACTRILLDGLARLAGALDLIGRIDEGKHTREEIDKLFMFPTVIYAPAGDTKLSVAQLGQLFFDFNALQTSVPTAMALALDQSNIYIQLANVLGKMPFFFDHGGVEPRRATLGKKSTAFTTQQTLVRTIRGAMEGRAFQESDSARVDKPNLTWENFENRKQELHSFFHSLGHHFGDRLQERDSLLYTSPGLQILGLIFNDLNFKAVLTPVDRAYFIQEVAKLDWSRYNPDWLGLLGQPETGGDGAPIVDGRGRARVALGKAGANTIRALIRYVRDKAGIDKVLPQTDDLLTEQEQADDASTIPALSGTDDLEQKRDEQPEEVLA
jgi:hypothetical protein